MNINLWVVNEETKTPFSDDPIYRFYFDLSAAEALKWAATLRPHALLNMGVPAMGAAWLEAPSTYLICMKDSAISPEFQRKIVERAQAEDANMRTVEMKTGHSPWLVDAGVFVGHLLDAVSTGV